ncbi:hypothetical protein Tco_1051307 [Tanacetum coccineum]
MVMASSSEPSEFRDSKRISPKQSSERFTYVEVRQGSHMPILSTRFGWVRFLRTKDKTPEVLKKFIVTTQCALNATVRYVRTDNGTDDV